jgi:hypothetical protein
MTPLSRHDLACGFDDGGRAAMHGAKRATQCPSSFHHRGRASGKAIKRGGVVAAQPPSLRE